MITLRHIGSMGLEQPPILVNLVSVADSPQRTDLECRSIVQDDVEVSVPGQLYPNNSSQAVTFRHEVGKEPVCSVWGSIVVIGRI
jgi:hypothetical protein